MSALPRNRTQVWQVDARSAAQTKLLGDVLKAVEVAATAQPRGPKPIVTFDLDSTLFDNRPRQLAILREFAQAFRLGGVERLALEHIDGWQVLATALSLDGAAGREAELRAAWRPFWSERFFSSWICKLDLPLPGAAEFVREVEAKGASVLYLTGRHEEMRPGTEASLAEGRFPSSTCLMKPTLAMKDTEWKELAVDKVRALGPVAACFDNEPAHANRLAAAFPSARVVWLRTDHSLDAEPLRDGIPGIDGFLR